MAQLHLALLGPFQATLDSAPVTDFESNKVRVLLAYLAAESARPHSRETLAELLWPDQATAVSLANLRHVLASLRRSIGDRAVDPPHLLITSQTIQFNAAGSAVIDFCQFMALTAYAVAPPSADACLQAVTLYHGPFLQGFAADGSPALEEWIVATREQVDRRMVRTLAQLVGQCVQRADYMEAAEWTRQQVALEPWNEEASRQLIWLLAMSGQRALALHEYGICRRTLAEQLEIEPQPETTSLAEKVRTGQVDLTEIESFRGKTLILPEQAPAHLLPPQHTPFFGREAELDRLAAHLGNPVCRLITLCGPGGIGKTRLAIETARLQSARFSSGAAFVDLSGVVQSEFLADKILHALAIPKSGSAAQMCLLVDFLHHKELLLVLDNFEHLVESAPQLRVLLDGAPRVKLLVTSRSRLNISPEWVVPLEGLDVPPTAQVLAYIPVQNEADQVVNPESYSAVQLFLHGVRRLQPDLVLMPEDERIVVLICQLLDGIPLAIEMASTWLRSLSFAAVLARLEGSLDLLATTLRDVPERHRSMRAVFDHSWQLLGPRERSNLCQMSVFRGGCTFAAAASVAGATLADLTVLIDKSWLRKHPSGRFDMHVLVRQYCEEQLQQVSSKREGEFAAGVHQRHCGYYATFLHDRISALNLQQTVMADMMEEFGNLQAAWVWAVDHGEMDTARDMILAHYFIGDMLGWYHFTIHLFEAAIRRLEPYLTDSPSDARRRQLVGTVLGWAYYACTTQYFDLGKPERAKSCIERNYAVQMKLEPSNARAEILLLNGWAGAWLAYHEGDYSAAQGQFRAMLTRFREARVDYYLYGGKTGALFWQAHALAALALVAWVTGRYAEARRRLQQALTLRTHIGELRYRSFNLCLLARVLCTTGDFDQAGEQARTALRLSASLGDQIGVASASLALGRVESELGLFESAYVSLQRSAVMGRKSGRLQLLLDSLIELGRVDLALGHALEAKRYFEEVLEMFAQAGTLYTTAVADAHLGLGWTALALLDVTEAKREFLMVLDAKMRSARATMDALAGLAEVCAAAGDSADAERLFAQVAFSDATAYSTRAHVAERAGALGLALLQVRAQSPQNEELAQVINGLIGANRMIES